MLINAIGGGVGLFTTQLAVKAGARVIGTVGTPGKDKRALEYGAERVVVTRNEDFEPAVLAFTDGRGVDLAIDSLGATMLDRTFNVVRKLGHIISIGEAEGQPFKNIRERILPRSQTFTRLHIGHVDPNSQAWKDGVTYIVARRARRLAEGADRRRLPNGRGGRDAPAHRIAPGRGQACSHHWALAASLIGGG